MMGEEEDLDEQSETPDPELCRACHEAEIDKSESVNSVLCKPCREKMIRYPVPKWLIAVALALLVVMAAALWRFPAVLKSYRHYAHASRLADNGEPNQALAGLHLVLQQYPDSTPVAIRMADIAMEKGYYDAASYVISEHLAGKQVDEAVADKVNGYVDRLNRYYNAQETVQELFKELGESKDQEKDLILLQEKLAGKLGDIKLDPGVLYYALASTSRDPKERKANYEACINADPTQLYAKVDLASLLRRERDFEGAEELLGEVLREEKNHPGAKRSLATIRLLQGEKEAALELAKAAYEWDPDLAYTWETYVISLRESGKTEEAKAMIAAREEPLEADTQAYFDGKMTLEDYYVGFKEVA